MNRKYIYTGLVALSSLWVIHQIYRYFQGTHTYWTQQGRVVGIRLLVVPGPWTEEHVIFREDDGTMYTLFPCDDAQLPVIVGHEYRIGLDYWTQQAGCLTITSIREVEP